jgi:hypothetical protein
MKTMIVLLAALLALPMSPASARIDGDEGGASAYPAWHPKSRGASNTNDVLVNRPAQH